MQPASDRPLTLAVRDLFADSIYRIPVYQREYAWEHPEVTTLLRDVRDCARTRPDREYFIGSLVVHSPGGDAALEVVDGQQRLTTLYLILTHPRVMQRIESSTRPQSGSLTYEGRDRSTHDLDLLARAREHVAAEELQDAGISGALTVIDRWLTATDGDERLSDDEVDFLLDRVVIVRTLLPPATDLNHYFEIMNTRGEQLEKHEVVKGHLMAPLRVDEHRVFARIWDACADMTRHVQASFSVDERGVVFSSDWDVLDVDEPMTTTFSGLLEAAGDPGPLGQDQPVAERRTTTVLDLLAGPEQERADVENPGPEDAVRYGSIVDFPNFLLHALKVHRREQFTWTDEAAANSTLDDKRLIERFREIRDREEVIRFAWTLLRLRFLFDKYVIKPDRYRDASADDSNWVLHSTRKSKNPSKGSPSLSSGPTFRAPRAEAVESASSNDLHARIVMAQSMFQVTDSGRARKNFLYGILEWLWRQPDDVDAGAFLEHLHGMTETRLAHLSTADVDKGTGLHHFVLNALDYKIWHRQAVQGDESLGKVEATDFRFRYRTSIEHFYPQHPDGAHGHQTLARVHLDALGNVCLMTRSDNSQRSNLVPVAKIREYTSASQSLKFQLMARVTRQRQTEEDPWGELQIEEHGSRMRELLLQALESPRDHRSA